MSRCTYRNTTDWFSPREAKRVKARLARSSASAAALPSLAPLGPLLGEVYVLRQSKPWEERRAVGNPTWNLKPDPAVSYRSASRDCKGHTGLQGVQSNACLTANARAMPATKPVHGPGYFLLATPYCAEAQRCSLTVPPPLLLSVPRYIQLNNPGYRTEIGTTE